MCVRLGVRSSIWAMFTYNSELVNIDLENYNLVR